MARRQDLQSADGVVASRTPEGKTIVTSRGAPTAGAAGFAPGCIYVNVANGSVYLNTGTSTSATWSLIGTSSGAFVAGVASGYGLARGVTALDGSNPTPVATGLATVVAATVTLEGSSAPGVGTSVLTVASTDYATGGLNVYAWKVTSNANPTLIASTGTENFEWIAVGTL